MFRPILFTQWKVSRWAVLLLMPLCVGLPILIVRLAARMSQSVYADRALDMLRITSATSVVFPVLAALTGIAFALIAWDWDHRTNHVYALSLPIERWRYALLKMGAGLSGLALPILGIFVGALIATYSTSLPPGLHRYPLSFGLRFLFAAVICYAIMFALAAGTIRTTMRIVLGLVVLIVVAPFVVSFINTTFGTSIPGPFELLREAFVSWPGPFNVFGGSWMLIDV